MPLQKIVTLSTQDNAKLLQQLKSCFKRTINWNEYDSEPKTSVRKIYLNHLINSSFQGVNRIFVLCFENKNDRTSHSTYYLPKVEIKDYNAMTDGRNYFDQPINSMGKTYENIKKIATGQGDDYTTGCLLNYFYLKDHYKMIAIDLSKQQALDSDPRAIQQINFTAKLDTDDGATMFYGATILFSQGTVKVL